MGTKNYFKPKKIPLNCVLQAQLLDNKWRGLNNTKIMKGRLIWIGNLTPTPLSQTYKVKLDYTVGQRPNVYVVEPELKKYDKKKIPHRFSDGSLCLFRYLYEDWHSSMVIADTIIPWTICWLYFYEIWLTTGKWLGKGDHPKAKSG